ncbi:MAG TPA: hypothetical protein VF171_08755, partial [Trueperaceae bacterium]
MPTSVRVLLPLPLPAFTYLPAHGQALPEIGQRVVVPWQHGIRLGIAVGHQETRGAQSVELREVIATLDEQPFVSAQALAALERMADHTCLPAGLVLANLLPYGLNIELEHEVRALVEDLGIPKDSFVPAAGVAPAQLELWRAQGLV